MMMTVFAATDMELFNSWENADAGRFGAAIGVVVIGLVIVNNLIALMTQSCKDLDACPGHSSPPSLNHRIWA